MRSGRCHTPTADEHQCDLVGATHLQLMNISSYLKFCFWLYSKEVKLNPEPGPLIFLVHWLSWFIDFLAFSRFSQPQKADTNNVYILLKSNHTLWNNKVIYFSLLTFHLEGCSWISKWFFVQATCRKVTYDLLHLLRVTICHKQEYFHPKKEENW